MMKGCVLAAIFVLACAMSLNVQGSDICASKKCPVYANCTNVNATYAVCECPTCPSGYTPVCGSDGKNYNTDCKLKLAACNANATISVASQGTCPTPCTGVTCPFYGECKVENGSATCECHDACFGLHSPLCGSDGVTYTNDCERRKAGCNQKKNITVTSQGNCPPSPCDGKSCRFYGICQVKNSNATCVCPAGCTAEYSPVCGSDKMKYSNDCQRRKASCEQSKNITVVGLDNCPTEEPVKVTGSPTSGSPKLVLPFSLIIVLLGSLFMA
eukprot:m.13540 g.13540  ORF g.13540 m.13540 type:complete len:271 (+) comp25014_c0_seq1:1719-2531(+)